jgi:hypothetical protein
MRRAVGGELAQRLGIESYVARGEMTIYTKTPERSAKSNTWERLQTLARQISDYCNSWHSSQVWLGKSREMQLVG